MKKHFSGLLACSRRNATAIAIDELENQIRRIQQENAEAALRVAQVIQDSLKTLSAFPNIERRGERLGTSELVVEAFVVVYRIENDVVEVNENG